MQDSSLPLLSAGAPVNKCLMVCIPGNERFYVVLDPFVDGTPCPPSPNYEKAVCVYGTCTVSEDLHMRACYGIARHLQSRISYVALSSVCV